MSLVYQALLYDKYLLLVHLLMEFYLLNFLQEINIWRIRVR